MLLLAYVLIKSKKRKRDIAFFFAVLGLTFLIETVIYVFFRAYEYYPMLLPSSPRNDGVIGNIISQFSIATVALLICVFRARFGSVVIASTIFSLIELLFLALGIYQQYWYRTWITFVGMIILFEAIRRWYESVMETRKRENHYFTILYGILALYLPTTNWIGILSGFVVFKENILIDPFISHAIIAIPKYLIQINLVYLLISRRASWFWHLAVVALFFLGDAALYYTKVINVKEGWLLIYSALSFATTYLYVYLMHRLLYSGVRYRS